MEHHDGFYFLLVCAFLLLCCSPTSSAQETEDEREFDYIKGSTHGPENWGNLKKEWSVCKTGESQSPIDLSSGNVHITRKLGRIRTRYRACNATLKNRGHDIAVEWEGDAGWFSTNRTKYKLIQAHWHSPSEHTVNGKSYDMELHMVHQSDDPNARHKLAVVALLYAIGQPDAFLSKLLSNVTFTQHSGGGATGISKMVDASDINVDKLRYYRYIGSLTVPPCTENVLWTVNKRVRTVSEAQLELLREDVHDYAKSNARPVQPLNRRTIFYNTPQGFGPAN